MNITNLTNVVTPNDLIVGVNQASNNLFMNLILLALFIIILMYFYNRDLRAVLIGDSTACLVLAIIGFFWGLITWHIIVIFLLILIFSVIALLFVE